MDIAFSVVPSLLFVGSILFGRNSQKWVPKNTHTVRSATNNPTTSRIIEVCLSDAESAYEVSR